jgi:lysophospholipase L1-like esterase
MNSPSRATGRIDRRARRWVGAVVGIVALLLTGCVPIAATGSGHLSPSPSRATASTGAGHPLSVVALGDSVPSGAACGCTPFPQLSASLLAAPGTGEVPTADDAVDGATSTDVLSAVMTDHEVQADIAAADVVEIEVGANDVEYSDACGAAVDCYQPTVPTVEQNVRDIVAEVHALTRGHPALVVLLDYWSVWLGGTYAAAQGQAYVDAATGVTGQVNAVIRQVAAATGSTYVDVRAAFKGPDYSSDETRYLAADGDHPNARGHALIAQAVVDAIGSALQGR